MTNRAPTKDFVNRSLLIFAVTLALVTGMMVKPASGWDTTWTCEPAPCIPGDATIDSATLFLYVGTTSEKEVRLHRVTAPWIETEVTWDNLGGSYDATDAGSFTPLGSGLIAVDVTDVVEYWAYGIHPNFGLLLEQGATDCTTYKSSEYGYGEYRPQLEICFTTSSGSARMIIVRPCAVVADAYIWEGSPYYNGGGWTLLYTGLVGGSEKQTLLRFDFEICEIPQEPCGQCDGGVTSLTLKFLGNDATDIVVREKGGKGGKGKKGNVIFDGTVDGGDMFSFDGVKKDGKLGSEISIFVDDVLNTKIHTSCSRPIGPGQISGDFEIIEGYSLRGGRICPLGEEPPEPPTGECAKGIKPQLLTMRYAGEDCGASDNSQDPKKIACSGDPESASPVYMIACDKKKIQDMWSGKAKMWFAGYVNLNETFEIDAMNEGESKLKAETVVYIFADNNLDVLLQSIRFHTSCSQPLSIGDQFGSLVLEEFLAEAAK